MVLGVIELGDTKAAFRHALNSVFSREEVHVCPSEKSLQFLQTLSTLPRCIKFREIQEKSMWEHSCFNIQQTQKFKQLISPGEKVVSQR